MDCVRARWNAARSEQRADEVLRSGDASDEALLTLLPLLQQKMYARSLKKK